jgi:5-methylcytosine-specific restriction endonuclease McrA
MKDLARASGDRGRARYYGVPYEHVNRGKVYDRDGWQCGICCEPIDHTLAHPDPRSASLDHVIPISRGGPHTYANCQAAHLDCNVAKSDRVGDELDGESLSRRLSDFGIPNKSQMGVPFSLTPP